MNQALEIIYYIFDKAVDLVFNKMQLVNGVYLGWVLMFIIIAAILIGSILAVPHAAESVSVYRNDQIYTRRRLGKGRFHNPHGYTKKYPD